jgi:hypothetical protein
MPDFNATADLHRVEMNPVRLGQPIKPSPRYLETAPIIQCINRVMGKRQADRVIYSITVPLEAGFGKKVLDYRDIEDIAARPDLPKSSVLQLQL